MYWNKFNRVPHRFWFQFRGILMAPPVLFMILCRIGEVERGWVIFPIGIAVFAAGVLLRIWAQIHLHYRLKQRKVLTTTGPYVFVRNPIYIANTVLLLSLGIVSELVWFIPLMLLWCIFVYGRVVAYEEMHLFDKYGKAYADYVEQTPRWIPKVQSPKSNASLNTRPFLWPSILAELHCVLLLLPFVLKEAIFD